MERRAGSTGANEEAQMLESTKRFAQDESGATSIEYRLIAAGIAVAILIAVASHGSQLMTIFGAKQAWHC
jgi:pilus assembly protein Flp/PilA